MNENNSNNKISIGTVNGNVNYTEHGDIHSVTNISQKSEDDISMLITELIKMISEENLSESDKEYALDDLDTLKEQLDSQSPNKIKITKALDSIKSFALRIPSCLNSATLIVNSINKLYSAITNII